MPSRCDLSLVTHITPEKCTQNHSPASVHVQEKCCKTIFICYYTYIIKYIILYCISMTMDYSYNVQFCPSESHSRIIYNTYNRIETSSPHTFQTGVYCIIVYSGQPQIYVCNCLDLCPNQASAIQEWCLLVLSCLFSGYEYFLLLPFLPNQASCLHCGPTTYTLYLAVKVGTERQD